MHWKRINDTIEVGTFWPLSRRHIQHLLVHGEHHRQHQIAPQHQQIYYLSFREGELHGEQHVYCPFWSCAVTTKIDGSANIQKSLLAVRKMVISTVKMVVYTTSSLQSSSSYYFKQFINEGCWYWLSFVIDSWTTVGDHHGDFLFW
jgi:hypothetical protein